MYTDYIKLGCERHSIVSVKLNSNTNSMGRVKELLMKMEERGFDVYHLEDKYVCSHHFDDIYLNQYISTHGDEGVCSYCGKKDSVIDLTSFAAHIGMSIACYFNDVDSENLPLASSFLKKRTRRFLELKELVVMPHQET